MFNVQQNLLLFSPVSDKSMEGVTVRHPPYQTRVGGKRDDSKPLDSQVAPEGVWVTNEESVDQTKELHHPLILSKVLMTLQQEHKVTSIAGSYTEFPRPLL